MSKEKGKTQNKKRKLTRQKRNRSTRLSGSQRATGSPIRRRTAYRLNECIRTGFAALQTGGIPSALSLKILTISLRSRTTRPPFLKPFAICITLLTLLSSVQLSLISRHAEQGDFKSSITIAPQMTTLTVSEPNTPKCCKHSLNAATTGLSRQSFLTFTIEAKDIKSARARLARIETDTLNHFKVIARRRGYWTGSSGLKCCMGFSTRTGNASTLRGNGYP